MSSDGENAVCTMQLKNTEMTGFGRGSINIYITISVLGILVNIGFLISSILKLRRGNGKTKISSLEKLLIFLSVIEIGISCTWVIQTTTFDNNIIIKQKCPQCKILGLVSIFLYISDWVILGLTIKQFKQIMLNPLDAILKPDKNIKKFLVTGFILAGLSTFLAWYGDLTGISVSIYNNYIIANDNMFYSSCI